MTAGTWTLPNVLTGLRLFAVPVVGTVLVVGGDSARGRLTALILFVAASVTDVLDGWLARRRDQCSDFGALADPIADKALVGTVLICLSQLGLVPWWATMVVLAREAAVTALRLTVLRHGVIPASRGGKVKTGTQTALIVLALAAPDRTGLLTAVALVTVVWTVATGLDYGAKAAALARAAVVPPRRHGGLVAVNPVDGAGPLLPAPGLGPDGWPGAGPSWREVQVRGGQQDGGADSSRLTS